MDLKFDQIIQESKKNRLTDKTKSIFLILKEENHPITAKSILEKMKSKDNKVDLSTVYRALKRLVLLDIITKVIRENVVLYELSNQFIKHHHHFTCNKCHTTYILDNCIVDKITSEDIAKLESHSIELFGICVKCNI